MSALPERLLIANRGEIACRIMRTARRLGIETVAVYSEADRDALHVRQADAALAIGPAPARASYLDIEAVLRAARESGAQAVHPGYGFLAENGEFAEACAQAGITFVGPPAAAIRAMGDKAAALESMAGAGVPVLPGFRGAEASDAAMLAAAERIGWPVLLKPSAGGGGKGMRTVHDAGEFPGALAAARREAASAFGDPRLIIEKLLPAARHVEVQIFADTQGHFVHLFDRDCSVQRRHQKIVEEAPAPGLSDATRARMGEAAITAARAVGYVGAGTVEFLIDATRPEAGFWFMEMNTRLQVEHPVTELVTGVDLVEWQLRVAAGEPLPLGQGALRVRGHAVEARIYAEDPEHGFLPASGRLGLLRLGEDTAGARVDTGVEEGDTISIHYDPMIAKLSAHGPDRASALRRLRRALAAVAIAGPPTNVAFLNRVAASARFGAGTISTGFVEEESSTLLAEADAPERSALALACFWRLTREAPPGACGFGLRDGFRLNQAATRILDLRTSGRELAIEAHALEPGYWRLDLPDGPLEGRASVHGARVEVAGGRGRMHGHAWHSGNRLVIVVAGRSTDFELPDRDRRDRRETAGGGHLRAPMPGRLIAVHAAPGDRVEPGAPLAILEAMKMEHTIVAPFAGTVTAVAYRAGDLVEEGAQLLVVETTEDGTH